MKRGINVEKNSEKEKIDFEKIQKDIRKYILDEINKKYKKNEEKVLCELLNAMGYETNVKGGSEIERNIINLNPTTKKHLFRGAFCYYAVCFLKSVFFNSLFTHFVFKNFACSIHGEFIYK